MDEERVRAWTFHDVEHDYDERDAILYALGVGLGSDPLDAGQLRYVFEQPDLAVVPSMASALAHPGFWLRAPEAGVDWVRVVHAEETVTLHGPLPPSARTVARARVTRIVDKGARAGAIVHTERTIADRDGGRALATVEESMFCRGDGGLSRSDDPSPTSPPVPDRDPDMVSEQPTLPQQALLYRLSGDLNPLHASPAIAAQAGFKRPILHGLATFGIATHAILRALCGYDPTALTSIGARFSAPVFPGETIRTELWQTEGAVRFQATVPERGVTALSRGHATVR